MPDWIRVRDSARPAAPREGSEIQAQEQPETRVLPVVADISREIVGIHASHLGRGPTKAKTVWRDDVVVCVLQDIFTKSEQVLIDAGKFEQVRSNRQVLQEAVEPLLRHVVEQATNSPVRAFLSQVGADGSACEIFLLEVGRDLRLQPTPERHSPPLK